MGFSIKLFAMSFLVSVSAVRDYNLEFILLNKNAPANVCTTAEIDDLYARLLTKLKAVLAKPAYNLKPTVDSDWGKYHPTTTRTRELQSSTCYYWCRQNPNPYMCYEVYNCRALGYRHLRSDRELSSGDIATIEADAEGAARGLLTDISSAGSYTATCRTALSASTFNATMVVAA